MSERAPGEPVTGSAPARIAVCQLDPVLLDLQGNIRRSTDAVRACVELGADVIVLPELVTSGYMFESRAEVESMALPRAHPVFGRWREALGATEAVVVAGFPEAGDAGRVYNSAAVVDRSGVRAVYRKAHLWNREKHFFTPGDEAPPVLSVPWGRLGVLICYDLEFPEMPRSLTLAGADLVAVPTNWSRDELRSGSEPPQVMIARAAARANHVFVAVCDRRGSERGQEWTGGSAVIDPEGWVLRTPDVDHVAVADVDLASARDRNLTDVNHVFADRRPELYTVCNP